MFTFCFVSFQCTTLINEYGQAILQLLVSELKPSEICKVKLFFNCWTKPKLLFVVWYSKGIGLSNSWIKINGSKFYLVDTVKVLKFCNFWKICLPWFSSKSWYIFFQNENLFGLGHLQYVYQKNILWFVDL